MVLDHFEAAISRLDVGTDDVAPECVAAWLPVAVRRLSGSLVFTNRVPGKDASNEAPARKEAPLSCPASRTERRHRVSLNLVAVPRTGIFTRLTEFSLSHVQFREPCALGDAFSSRWCSCFCIVLPLFRDLHRFSPEHYPILRQTSYQLWPMPSCCLQMPSSQSWPSP